MRGEDAVVINWTELTTFEISQERDVSAPWILVLETLRDATHLQIKAEGSWAAMGGSLTVCGPMGMPEYRWSRSGLSPPTARWAR